MIVLFVVVGIVVDVFVVDRGEYEDFEVVDSEGR